MPWLHISSRFHNAGIYSQSSLWSKMTHISGYISDQHINIGDSHINMVDEPGNWYSTKEDKIKFEMNKILLFWLSQKQYVGHWGFKFPRSGITRHPAQISICSLKLGPPVSFFFPLSFLPSKTTKRYWQRLLLAPLCSSPHPICSLPEFPFKSTQPYKERTQWKCPKLLDTKNVFKKSSEK